MFGHWQDSHNIYILMPYAAGGELLHLIHQQESLGEGAYLQACLRKKAVLAYARIDHDLAGGKFQMKLEM